MTDKLLSEEIYKAWKDGTLTDADKDAIIDDGLHQQRHSGIPETLAEDNEDAARCRLRGESDWAVPNHYPFAGRDQLVDMQKAFDRLRKEIQAIFKLEDFAT